MKAMIYRHYGDATQFELVEKDMPIPKEDEVLIRVIATSINDWDHQLLTGALLNRLMGGWFRPKKKVLGSDIAGIVVDVGKKVTQFEPNDNILADISGFWGGFAEFVCIKESLLTKKPETMSFEEASAIPQAGLLAFQSIEKNISPGMKILINGAGGGAGSFAIQLAKLQACTVTAVDRSSKLDFMRSLGADKVVDFTKTDYTDLDDKFDVIIDFAAHLSPKSAKKVLKPNGRYFIVGGTNKNILSAGLHSLLPKKENHPRVSIFAHHPNRGLQQLIDLVTSESIGVNIDKVFSLCHLADAFEYFSTGHAQGKIVIKVSDIKNEPS